MKSKFPPLLLASVLLLFASGAKAAATFSCSISTAPVSYTQTYSASVNSVSALSLSVSCTKTASGTATTVSYTVTPSNGLYASGTQNQAALAGNNISYDIYTDTTCTIPWSGSGSMVFAGGASGTIITQTLTYYGCVRSAQPLLPIPGTPYSDTVSMTLASATAGVTITGTNPSAFPVNITVLATCSISTVPAITFNYISSGSAANTSSPFGITCTNTTPYTLSLDAGGVGYTGSFSSPTGTYTNSATNLTYSLTLPTTMAGTGLAQSYTMTGYMAAGQGGKCTAATCSATDIHTLTVSY